jgi:internalin A
LTHLTTLELSSNAIIDVNPLSGLTQLTTLYLGSNEIIDVSPLSGLTHLTELVLRRNEIIDVSALEGLINLKYLYLKENPISDLTPLRRLKSKNPDVEIDIDINAVTTAVSEETWMPDANLRAKVRDALDLAPGDVLTQQVMRGLTELDASVPWDAEASEKIIYLTGLEHATQLTSLNLWGNEISDISPLSGLSQLTGLYLNGNEISESERH